MKKELVLSVTQIAPAEMALLLALTSSAFFLTGLAGSAQCWAAHAKEGAFLATCISHMELVMEQVLAPAQL